MSSPDAGSLDDSATLLLESDNVNIYNVNFENGYGEGAQVRYLTSKCEISG